MINIKTENGTVQGHLRDDRFAPVLDAFVENFNARGEQGAAVAITHEGQTVVDLWGGWRDGRAQDPWTEDTVTVVFSTTKGMLALCANMLIDPHAPVAELWPDFATGGKEAVTLQMMLDHTAGVPALRERLEKGAMLDAEAMAEKLAREEAFFTPGTRVAYHGLTFAWTVGEMVRRAAGKTAGTFFAEEVAGPLGEDFWIGQPEEAEPRFARAIKPKFDPADPPPQMKSAFIAALQDKGSIPQLFFGNDGGFDPNAAEYRRAEIGSATGVGTARALSRVYGVLAQGGGIDGVKLVSPEAVGRMARVTAATHDDATLRQSTRWGAGFMRGTDNRHDPVLTSAILGEHAFGHSGLGGSIAFADPECGLGFGYVMTQMGHGVLLNPRGQSLIDAAYRALGYRSAATGAWRR
jgi:CubicO group peptidase (beta-lactamase class C family)